MHVICNELFSLAKLECYGIMGRGGPGQLLLVPQELVVLQCTLPREMMMCRPSAARPRVMTNLAVAPGPSSAAELTHVMIIDKQVTQQTATKPMPFPGGACSVTVVLSTTHAACPCGFSQHG